MERDDEKELYSHAERMRRGMKKNRREVSEQPTEEFDVIKPEPMIYRQPNGTGELARVGENMFVELTPVEEEIAKTVCPNMLQLELGVEFVDPHHPELGFKIKE